MTMLKTAFVSLIMLAPGIASAGTVSNDLRKLWGNGILEVCVAHAIEITQTEYDNGLGACIGESRKDLCRGWKNGKASKSLANNGDDGVMLMMVARKITETGAYFCPTQIESHNKNESINTVYTDYTDLAVSDPEYCVWLCKPGYIGKECETKIEENTACIYENTTKVDAWRYDNFTIKPSSDIERSIDMFVDDQNSTCNYGKVPQQHNVVLAVSKWEPNSHGAFVRQFSIRAQRSGWKDMYSIVAVSPAINGSLQLVCQSGYEPDGTQSKCVKIKQCISQEPGGSEEPETPEEVPAKETDFCPGWKDSFDDSIHVYYKTNATDDCFVYRCLQPGYAFVDARKNKCAACTEDLRTGVDALGMCVTCKTTQRFDKDSKKCVDLKTVSKAELLYGKGNIGPNQNYKDDCWSKATSGDYVSCVTGATEK